MSKGGIGHSSYWKMGASFIGRCCPEKDRLQVEDRPVPHFHTFLYVFHGLDGAREGCMESSGEEYPELCRHSLAYVD